jgi:hypothetical protein
MLVGLGLPMASTPWIMMADGYHHSSEMFALLLE